MDRRHRLTPSRAFGRVFAEGRRGQSGSVVAVARPSGEQRAPRVGVAASKRVGSAVRRNRAKRRLREAVRARLACIPAGTDVVLIASPAVVSAPFDAVRADVVGALERAGAIAC